MNLCTEVFLYNEKKKNIYILSKKKDISRGICKKKITLLLYINILYFKKVYELFYYFYYHFKLLFHLPIYHHASILQNI